MHNQTLFIKKDVLEEYLNAREYGNNRLIRHMIHYLDIADTYYAISKDTFKNDTDLATFSHTMAELAALSGMETCMYIFPNDNTQLLKVLERDKKETPIHKKPNQETDS